MTLALIPIMAQAQITQVTDEQKQEALQKVTEFCNLLSQWSNGQRTLDSKIYALCSGNDCSAYDDISTNKETTLRNYMLGIQKKYPKNLQMQIAQPSLSDVSIFYEPEQITITNMYEQTILGNSASVGLVPHYSMSTFENAYIVFGAKQTVPSLSKSTERKIIYDVKSGKITAFVTGSGTFVSFLEAFELMTKNKYKEAISKFEYAASNPRSSMKNLCYRWAAELSMYILDVDGGLRFAKLSGDKYYENSFLAIKAITNGNIQESISYLVQVENYAQNENQHKNDLGSLHSVLGMLYGIPSAVQDLGKAVTYFRKAISENKIDAGYHLWLLSAQADVSTRITMDEAVEHLLWSAEKGYPPSYLIVYLLYEGSEDAQERNNAEAWLEASANAGDAFGMAYYGRLLLERGNITKGKEWLRKSLEGNGLELEINMYSGTIDWPTSRADIQILLDSGMQSSQTASQPQSNTQPSSHINTTTESQSNTPVYSSTTSTSHNNNTYHYSKRYNHSFNEKKDDYFMGLSIGYVQKQWTFDFKDGRSEKGGFWDDSKQISGVQAGIRVNPQFGYGFGLNTGLYYEYYYSKSDRMNYTDDYGQYTGTLQEHALYLPMHLEYRMNFSKYFQLFFYGGIGLDYGLANSIKWVDCDDDSYSETIDNIYDSNDCPDWQRFNYSLEYGGGIRTSHLQLNFTMSQGLRNMSSTDEYKVYQGKNLMLSLSIMF